MQACRSNTVDLGASRRFIFACATDQRFNAPQMIAEMESIGGSTIHQPISDALLCDPVQRERLLMLKGHFRFADWEPTQAPGPHRHV